MNHPTVVICFFFAFAMASIESAAAHGFLDTIPQQTPTPASSRELSPIRFQYKDGLTVCPCDSEDRCLNHLHPEDMSECRLCFLARRDEDNLVESVEYLSFTVKGQREQPIVQDYGVVQPSAVLRCGSRSCMVKAPVSINVEEENPEIIVARGTVVLRASDEAPPEMISFAQILNLEEGVPLTPSSQRFDSNEKEQVETSGYAMITGVVILLPGLWGLAVYGYHRMLHRPVDDETEADVELGHDDDDEPSFQLPKPITVHVNNDYDEGEDGEEWETISCE